MKGKIMNIMLSATLFAGMLSGTALADGEKTGFEGITVNPTPIGNGAANTVSEVLGVVQWIGFIVGIAMLIWIGIKYLTAGAAKKAEVKETLVPWIVGAALVALGPTIALAVFNAF